MANFGFEIEQLKVGSSAPLLKLLFGTLALDLGQELVAWDIFLAGPLEQRR